MVTKRSTGRLTKKMRGKLRLTFGIILALFFLLVGRLIYHVAKNGNRYETIVLGQQNHSSTRLEYERGQIYDRNGNVLATNEKIYSLILEPKNILTEYKIGGEMVKKYYEPTLDALVKYMGLDRDSLVKAINESPDSYYVVFKKGLTYDEVADLKDFLNYKNKPKENLTEEEKQKKKEASLVSGISFEESYKRVYPYDSLACRVLGFVSDGNVGNWGLEQFYNDELNGQNGRSYYYFDEELNQQETVHEPENGESLVTTIDMSIQKIIEDAIAKFDGKIGSNVTSILVMNPKNGEILGMASSHPFNLNQPMTEEDLLQIFSKDEIKKMNAYTTSLKNSEQEKAAAASQTDEDLNDTEASQTDEDLNDTEADQTDEEADQSEEAGGDAVKEAEIKAAEEKEEEEAEEGEEKEKQMTIYDGYAALWKNPMISTTYEPGSTYKPFTVATGYESGTLKGEETYYCDGAFTVGNRRIGCSHVHNTVNLKTAIANSCNVAMMGIACRIKEPVFYDYQTLFGFGKTTGIDLPGETSAKYLRYYAGKSDSSLSMLTNSFGQNFNCTMVQLAAGFASLINGGEYYVPHLVKEIQNSKGDQLKEIGKTLKNYTVSPETSRILRSYLRETVLSGTGTKAQIPGYSIGGKTGTAEKIPRNKEDYYVSFIGFTPADDPELLIYVTIDEPNVDNQASAALAVLLEREVMTRIIKYLGMKPTEEIKKKDINYEDVYIDEYTELFDYAFYKGILYEQYYADKKEESAEADDDE